MILNYYYPFNVYLNPRNLEGIGFMFLEATAYAQRLNARPSVRTVANFCLSIRIFLRNVATFERIEDGI